MCINWIKHTAAKYCGDGAESHMELLWNKTTNADFIFKYHSFNILGKLSCKHSTWNTIFIIMY